MPPFDEIQFDHDDHADVALLVAGVREFPSEEFARALDARVARRFAPAAGAPARGRRWSPRRRAGAGGTGIALVAAAVAAVIVVGGGSGGSVPALATHGLHNGATLGAEGSPAVTRSAGPVKSPSAGLPAAQSSTLNSAATFAAPTVPGARQIQSAQISLSTPNLHVNQVSQEVLNVVAAEHGSVQSSHVTAATGSSGGGYATFTLSFPTGNLQAAMTQLSRMRYAAVSSRTDASQNVSSRYGMDQQRLADAQALRASLLKQLQTADSQTAIDSIEAQIKAAEGQIAHWQSALHSLQRRISYSDVTVQVNEGGLPVVPVAASQGLTIGRAAHDALRVLVVSAGVAVIALAVLVPLGLVAALLMWLWVWLRQRRREQALDAS